MMGKTIKELLAEANAQVTNYEASKAVSLVGNDGIVFVDVRDNTELHSEGKIPGSTHASRGMLEFLLDPASPYHNNIFSQEKEFIFYCQSGGRSALAAKTAQEMGLQRVATLAGGFMAWKEVQGKVESA